MMAKIKSWEVSDEFWNRVEPLIPKRKRDTNVNYTRRQGGGRKPMPCRKVFEGIVYVLRTGIQWKALPIEFGSSSSIHAYFQEWERHSYQAKGFVCLSDGCPLWQPVPNQVATERAPPGKRKPNHNPPCGFCLSLIAMVGALRILQKNMEERTC